MFDRLGEASRRRWIRPGSPGFPDRQVGSDADAPLSEARRLRARKVSRACRLSGLLKSPLPHRLEGILP